MTDPIADFINRIKTASAAGRELVSIPYSELKFHLAETLAREGYVKSVSKRGKKNRRVIDVELLYTNGKPRIGGARRMSKPSRRLYRGFRELKPVRQGTGIAILSTPEGVVTGERAREKNVGGEVLVEIW